MITATSGVQQHQPPMPGPLFLTVTTRQLLLSEVAYFISIQCQKINQIRYTVYIIQKTTINLPAGFWQPCWASGIRQTPQPKERTAMLQALVNSRRFLSNQNFPFCGMILCDPTIHSVVYATQLPRKQMSNFKDNEPHVESVRGNTVLTTFSTVTTISFSIILLAEKCEASIVGNT